MALDISTINLQAQNTLHDCAVTVLEYLTGTHRKTIVADIGHDGSIEVNCKKKLIGVHAEEIVRWLEENGYETTRLLSRAWAEEEHPSKEPCFILVDDVRSKVDKNIAIVETRTVSINSGTQFRTDHVYAWIGDVAIDPGFGHCREIDGEIIGAIIIRNLSIDEVKETLNKQNMAGN